MDVEQQFGDEVRILGIGGLGSVDEMREFVDRTGSDAITHLPDEDGHLWDRFDVRSHGTYVLIDGDGTVTSQHRGNLRAAVEDLIAS